MDYQPLTQNTNMDILMKEPNNSLNGIGESDEVINNIVVKQPIINLVESFYVAKILTQQIYLKM